MSLLHLGKLVISSDVEIFFVIIIPSCSLPSTSSYLFEVSYAAERKFSIRFEFIDIFPLKLSSNKIEQNVFLFFSVIFWKHVIFNYSTKFLRFYSMNFNENLHLQIRIKNRHQLKQMRQVIDLIRLIIFSFFFVF